MICVLLSKLWFAPEFWAKRIQLYLFALCLGFSISLPSYIYAATQSPTSNSATTGAEKLKWKRIRGDAKELAISANGLVFATEFVNYTWRWTGERGRGWRLLPGRFKQIAAEPAGKPWAITPSGKVYRYNGILWDRSYMVSF